MFKWILLTLAIAAWLLTPGVTRAADAAHDTAAAAHDAADATLNAPQHAGEAMPAEAEAHGGHGGHAQPPLLPSAGSREVQLQAMWTLIIFIVLLMVLYPTAWRNVLAGLKKREERIRSDIADAEAARKRAEETLGQYNQQLAAAEGQVREIIAKASADAERIATSMRMQAQQEAEEIKERANREIETARKIAVADIYAQAADLSTNIAEKILRRNLNAADQRDLVDRSLEQLQTAGKL